MTRHLHTSRERSHFSTSHDLDVTVASVLGDGPLTGSSGTIPGTLSITIRGHHDPVERKARHSQGTFLVRSIFVIISQPKIGIIK
jgi:hypothetical protein